MNWKRTYLVDHVTHMLDGWGVEIAGKVIDRELQFFGQSISFAQDSSPFLGKSI